MASTSGEGSNSGGNIRKWLAETFDGHETMDDESSDSNVDRNGSLFLIRERNGSLVNSSDQASPVTLESREPYIGMEFESAEEAREFYEMYGRRMGFTIRNNRTRRSSKDNAIIGREFCCSKEGFRAGKCSKTENSVFQSRPSTREGCNAMLKIMASRGKWVIYAHVKDHNHELNPFKMLPRRSHRIAFCEDKKDLKIRELTTELHREKKKSAAYKLQLQMVLKCIEEHTQRLSLKVDVVSKTVKKLESEEQHRSCS